MYLLALSVGGWVLCLQSLFLRFVKGAWFSSHAGAAIFAFTVYILIAVLFYRIFIIDEMDQKIVDKYASAWHNNQNKRRDSFIAVFIAAVPYIAMISLKMFFPR